MCDVRRLDGFLSTIVFAQPASARICLDCKSVQDDMHIGSLAYRRSRKGGRLVFSSERRPILGIARGHFDSLRLPGIEKYAYSRLPVDWRCYSYVALREIDSSAIR